MHDSLVLISLLLGVGGFLVLVIGATVIGVVLFRRRSRLAGPFSKLGLSVSNVGAVCRFSTTLGGRSFQADLHPEVGLLIRVPCRAGANLSIGAKVALAGLTGTIPPDREAVDLQDASFAGLSIWTDNCRWAESLLDETTRPVVLALLRPGSEIRSVFITPEEVCVRALAIGEDDVTAERMAQWMDDVQKLAAHAEATRALRPTTPLPKAAIPSTLVLV